VTTRDPIRVPVKDPETDRALEDVRRTISDLRKAQPRLIESVSLANGTRTVIKHGQGRKYVAVFPSAIRGASATGRIVEEEPTDRTREIWLTATGWGGAITVDLMVWV
jgi:hypothetical protein